MISAFALYFQLVNLAEARGRVRALRRERAPRATACSTIRSPRPSPGCAGGGRDDATLDAIVADLRVTPVLTAHPTEARRRTILVALRRCAVLLERLDDPRLTPAEDREIRRRLREEITLLWRTSDLRSVAPEPLDEVRTAMALFDATLFTLVPRLYRSARRRPRRPWPETGAPARGRRASRPSSASGRGSVGTATATRSSRPT